MTRAHLPVRSTPTAKLLPDIEYDNSPEGRRFAKAHAWMFPGRHVKVGRRVLVTSAEEPVADEDEIAADAAAMHREGMPRGFVASVLRRKHKHNPKAVERALGNIPVVAHLPPPFPSTNDPQGQWVTASRELGRAPLMFESVDAENTNSKHGQAIKVGRGYLIGVAHERELALKNPRLHRSILRAAQEGGVFHEGPQPEPVVRRFASKTLGAKRSSTWEPAITKKSAPLVLDLFGGSAKALHRQVTSHPNYDPKASILDNLVRTAPVWNATGETTHRAVTSLLKRAKADKRAHEINPESAGLLDLAHQGMEHFKRFQRIGFSVTFPQDHGHPEDYTRFGKVAQRANAARVIGLYRKLKRGGVFFAGSSHLAAVRQLDRQQRMNEGRCDDVDALAVDHGALPSAGKGIYDFEGPQQAGAFHKQLKDCGHAAVRTGRRSGRGGSTVLLQRPAPSHAAVFDQALAGFRVAQRAAGLSPEAIRARRL